MVGDEFVQDIFTLHRAVESYHAPIVLVRLISGTESSISDSSMALTVTFSASRMSSRCCAALATLLRGRAASVLGVPEGEILRFFACGVAGPVGDFAILPNKGDLGPELESECLGGMLAMIGHREEMSTWRYEPKKLEL